MIRDKKKVITWEIVVIEECGDDLDSNLQPGFVESAVLLLHYDARDKQ